MTSLVFYDDDDDDVCNITGVPSPRQMTAERRRGVWCVVLCYVPRATVARLTLTAQQWALPPSTPVPVVLVMASSSGG